MNKQFYIFIGRSGCGKGTQAELLKTYIESGLSTISNLENTENTNLEVDAGNVNQNKVIHITTGGSFREFVNGDSESAKISRNINQTGGLQPEFLAIWNWSNIFINQLTGKESVILDGAPRRLIEIPALKSALDFYGYEKTIVVYLDVTNAWAIERLMGRGREDDTNSTEVNKKMAWFESDVVPVINWYNSDPEYRFVHINGEQSIEDIHMQIVAKVASLV